MSIEVLIRDCGLLCVERLQGFYSSTGPGVRACVAFIRVLVGSVLNWFSGWLGLVRGCWIGVTGSRVWDLGLRVWHVGVKVSV